MSKKKQLVISIVVGIFGLSITLVSCVVNNVIAHGILFGLGISIATTAIIDIYEFIMNYSKKDEFIKQTGLLDINYNISTSSQEDIYNNSKQIRVIFSAGSATFRKYQDAITESIVKYNCKVQIVLSNTNILKSGMYLSGEDETELAKKDISNIIQDIQKNYSGNHGGSLELRYSPIAPIGSVEIKDNKYCIVVPYMYKRHSAVAYHTTYRNTGKESDIYHMWEKHFEEIWQKSETILKYPDK